MILIIAVVEQFALLGLVVLSFYVPAVGMGVAVYSLIGIALFMYLDHKNNGRLFKWLDDCPPQIGALLVPQIVILWGWPVLLCLHLKKND